MKKKIRTLLAGAAVVVGSFAASFPSTPAHACTGDPCDGICDTMRTLNQKLPPKLKLTDCGLR